MRWIRPWCAAIVIAGWWAVPAFAQDRTPPAVAEVAPAEAATFASLEVGADELPKTMELVKGIHTVSRHPRVWFEQTSVTDLLPTPRAKCAQSFRSKDGASGTMFVFDYGGSAPVRFGMLLGWARGYLYGEGKGPTAEHPETLHVAGQLVIVLSFPRGDPAAEWLKGRLRSRFGMHASPWSKELNGLIQAFYRADDKSDIAAATKAIDQQRTLADTSSFLHFLLAELAFRVNDWKVSQRAYAKALELHRKRIDPMHPDDLISCRDGLGIALIKLKRPADAIPHFERAVELARKFAKPTLPHPLYNLACAHALLEHWEKAHAALAECLQLEPKLKPSVGVDPDLAGAMERPEFQRLLGP